MFKQPLKTITGLITSVDIVRVNVINIRQFIKPPTDKSRLFWSSA